MIWLKIIWYNVNWLLNERLLHEPDSFSGMLLLQLLFWAYSTLETLLCMFIRLPRLLQDYTEIKLTFVVYDFLFLQVYK